MSYHHPEERAGFTLLETLLVIILIALLASWSLPQWRIYRQGLQLEQTAVQLLTFLTHRQAHASWLNRSLFIWAQEGDTWCIGVDNPAGGDCQRSDEGHFTPADRGVALVAVSQNEMGFYGLRNTAQGGHLILVNEAGRIRVIISSRGRVRLCAEQQRVLGIVRC